MEELVFDIIIYGFLLLFVAFIWGALIVMMKKILQEWWHE